MPQLKSLILGSSKGREACAVIYGGKRAKKHAALIWCGTGDLELSRGAVESWRKVASDSCHQWTGNEGYRVLSTLMMMLFTICAYQAESLIQYQCHQIRQEGRMERMA